jgi:hypothetical protein
MTNPKEIAKSELGKIIFHLWQNKNHQRNESTPAMHNISWSEDFAEAIIDALGLEFVSDDSEAKDGDLGKDSFGVTYKFSEPNNCWRMSNIQPIITGDNCKIIQRQGKPVVNIKDIKDE